MCIYMHSDSSPRSCTLHLLVLSLLRMGPRNLLLASLATASVFLCMFPHANSQIAFPPVEAYGPAAASPEVGGLELSPGPPPRVVNIDDHGATAGDVDSTEAFLRAWEDACNSDSPSVLLVPEGKTYHLMSLRFTGPCRAPMITVMIKGTMEAPSNRSFWLDRNLPDRWITFEGIDHLHVMGGGVLNGNGHDWWINSCKVNKSMKCVTAPTALYFRNCSHLIVEDLKVSDSMQMHVVISDSSKVVVSRLFISAQGWSPNTDGIHVSNSGEVLISDSIISTGDDCISIVSGSEFVHATGIFCGPGHGISIGSLGANKSWAHVCDVLVEKATLVGTTNGVRIKTWQGGKGSAERITFQDISMVNVTNPIIINQSYCDSKSKIPCSEHEEESAVAVHNIRYSNIHGTSSSKDAINFMCSSAVHCDGIVMQNVALVGQGGSVTCSLLNARVQELGHVFPYCRADM